jgi:hypothetical protein
MKTDLKGLSHADRLKMLDFLIFFQWTERPFREVVDLGLEYERSRGVSPSRKPGLLSDLRYFGAILRGALGFIRLAGITEGWLFIAGINRS